MKRNESKPLEAEEAIKNALHYSNGDPVAFLMQVSGTFAGIAEQLFEGDARHYEQLVEGSELVYGAAMKLGMLRGTRIGHPVKRRR